MFFKKKVNVIVSIEGQLLAIDAIKGSKAVGRMLCIIHKESNSITISDIDCKRNNNGYGSLMIQQLVEYSYQNNMSYIDGWLSDVDYEHKERLYHFYRKFGFEIVPNRDGMKFADIKLIL